MNKKKIGSIILLILVALFLFGLYDYLSYRHKNAVSDAAFVKSDAIYTLGFRVGGTILRMLHEEGDRVHKGELLAQLDPTDYRIALQKVRHRIDALRSDLEALRKKRDRLLDELTLKSRISKNDIGAGDKKLQALRYQIMALEAQRAKLAKDRARYRRLYAQKLVSLEERERVYTAYDALARRIDAAKQRLASYLISTANLKERHKITQLETAQIRELDLSITALGQRIEAARQDVRSLKNKISYCRLVAPVEGRIAKKFVNTDRTVSKGYPIYALADTRHKHVEVLLSEKKLHGVAPGNRVRIKPDALRGRTFLGHVQSILPTSASTFSLVPRDIASGEFTKLVQRFVVRIAFDDNASELNDLLIGMGASVAIERSER